MRGSIVHDIGSYFVASLVDKYVSIVRRSLISKRRTIAVGVNITYCEKHILGRFESCLLHHFKEHMSKGDKQRPTDQKKFGDNWDVIFGKKKEDKKDDKKKS